MNGYQPKVPHAAFAACALALCAVTLGAFVVAPATLDARLDARTPLAAKRNVAPVEVAISPARIQVIGTRAPDVAWALPDDGRNCKPQV